MRPGREMFELGEGYEMEEWMGTEAEQSYYLMGVLAWLEMERSF